MAPLILPSYLHISYYIDRVTTFNLYIAVVEHIDTQRVSQISAGSAIISYVSITQLMSTMLLDSDRAARCRRKRLRKHRSCVFTWPRFVHADV